MCPLNQIKVSIIIIIISLKFDYPMRQFLMLDYKVSFFQFSESQKQKKRIKNVAVQ
jgi:hypothetical protein